MMIVQENDRRVIPEKYLKMSVEEIEQEKKKMLAEIKARPPIVPDKPRPKLEPGLIKF